MTMIGFLVWFGLVRRRHDGSLVWPIDLGSRWLWEVYLHDLSFTSRSALAELRGVPGPDAVAELGSPLRSWRAMFGNQVGLFRNRPDVVKYQRGRLLPRRWGIRVLALEIGDRSGEHMRRPEDRFSPKTATRLADLVRQGAAFGWEKPRTLRAAIIDRFAHYPAAFKVADVLDRVSWAALRAGNGLVDAIIDADPGGRERSRS